MLDLIYHLPEQIEDAFYTTKSQISKFKIQSRSMRDKIRNIVICGMGGSGIGGDILQSLAQTKNQNFPIPIFVVKDYSLPGFVQRNSLFFGVSYSGYTEETIACYRQAVKTRCVRICISSGGPLSRLALINKDFLIKIPKGFPPRSAIGYLFIPLLISLQKFFPGKVRNWKIPESIIETVTLLKKERDNYEQSARELASRLKDKIPVILAASPFLAPVADRWRTEFNENSKVFAHSHTIPEYNHNEIVGMELPKRIVRDKIFFLILDDGCGSDFPVAKKSGFGNLSRISPESRNRLRTELTLKILKEAGFLRRVAFFNSCGKSELCRIFSLIMQGSLLSYFLALENRVDPMPVKRIEQLKQMLRKR